MRLVCREQLRGADPLIELHYGGMVPWEADVIPLREPVDIGAGLHRRCVTVKEITIPVNGMELVTDFGLTIIRALARIQEGSTYHIEWREEQGAVPLVFLVAGAKIRVEVLS